jgi:hypothetical protein
LTEQASKGNAKVGHGPSSGICADDIVGRTESIKQALKEMMYRVSKQHGNRAFFKVKQEQQQNAINVTTMADSNEDMVL